MFKVIENKPIVIPVPEKMPLCIEDGFAFADAVLKPMAKAIVSGPQQIIITIAEDRPLYNDGRTSRTIKGDFFAGLFQNLLIALRDEHSPQTKFQAARENIFVAVNNGQPDEKEPIDVIKDIFNKPWVTYDPVEQAFWERVSFGLQKANGEIVMAAMGPDRMFLNGMDKEEDIKLFQWIYQVARGLDIVFTRDLSIDPAAIEQATTTPAPTA